MGVGAWVGVAVGAGASVGVAVGAGVVAARISAVGIGVLAGNGPVMRPQPLNIRAEVMIRAKCLITKVSPDCKGLFLSNLVCQSRLECV